MPTAIDTVQPSVARMSSGFLEYQFQVLGISEANVHSTLHVARERLRRELAPYLVEK